jgi:hypothetical protein
MTRTALALVWPPNHLVASRAGHKAISPVEAIRRKCLDCSGQQPAEVKLCETVTCPLWPFRAGRHPYTRKSLLEANSGQCPSPGTLVPQDRPPSGMGLQEADFREGGDRQAEATAVAAADLVADMVHA